MSEDFVNALGERLPSHRSVEGEDTFLLRIAQECRRAERSHNRFVLVLVQGFHELRADETKLFVSRVFEVVREIDTPGWYQTGTTLGILFAELGDTPVEDASLRVIERIRGALAVIPGLRNQVEVSAHILPRDMDVDANSQTRPRREDSIHGTAIFS